MSRSPAISRRARRAAVVVAGLVALGGAVALADVGSISGPATVERRAERLRTVSDDLAVVFDVGDVDRFTVEASVEAAHRAGGSAVAGRTGSLGMRGIARGGAVVHAPPAGWLIPMSYIALPGAATASVLGVDVAAALTSDTVAVMNRVTADLTGAAVGDVVEMQAADGSAVAFQVASIVPYEQLGGSELAFTTGGAARLGATADTRVVIWGFPSREALDRALAEVGIIGRADTRVDRSWQPPDPDGTLSVARTKAALGEPWYRFNGDGSIAMHPDWQAANLTPSRVLLDSTIRISARCHVRVVDGLRAALAEVAAAGLAGAIDVANANTYGGCYVPRFDRLSGQIGSLSRHTYGMALDTNTVANCQGCRPVMNCDVVRIFRRHGFAWGGNFRRPDGMHFEWVGERRDQIPYPSTYCPNATGPATEAAPVAPIGREVLIAGADDGSDWASPGDG